MAEVLFRDGRALFEQGKYDEACPKLAESHRLEPKPGTILNVAFCHEQQGKIATAWAEFMEAATLAGRAKQAAREKAARERVVALEARLSKLKLEVTAPAPGVVITLDDRVIAAAAWTTALPLDPGAHVVTAKAEGRAPWTTTVTIEAGPSTSVVTIPALAPTTAGASITPNPIPSASTTPLTAPVAPHALPSASASASVSAPVPAPVPAPAPVSAPVSVPATAPVSGPADHSSSSGGLSTAMIAGLAAGGVGVAGVVVGSIFGARTFAKRDAGNAECDGRYCSQKGLDLHDQAETSATLSTVAFGVGIAGLGAGAALFFLSRRPAPSSSKPTRTSLWIAPGSIGPTSLSIGGSF